MRRWFLAALLAAAPSMPAHAAPKTESTESLDQRARLLLGEIREADERRQILDQQMNEGRQQHRRAEAACGAAEQRLDRSQRQLEVARAELAKRARGAWRIRGADTLGGLARTENWSTVARRSTHLGHLVAHASTRAHEQASIVNEHELAAQDLGTQRQVLATRTRALEVLEQATAEEGKRKRSLLTQVLDEHQRSAEIERKTRDTIADAARQAGRGHATGDRTGLAARKGHLPRPVAGEVVVPFGDHRDPTYRTSTHTNGVAFRAERHSAVHAVADGRVAFQDYVDGFGTLLILEHGESFLTVYGHLADATRSAGEELRAGEVLGHVGTSGLTSEPRLYFEIRRGREALDPRDWWGPTKDLAGDDHS